MDAPSAQLCDELRHSIQEALATRRPLLTHLNDDSSWLIQIPRPENAVKRGTRFYYNILVDPWLKGGQSDVASWFSQQFHATPSAVQTIAELEELIRDVEVLAFGARKDASKIRKELALEDTLIDAVAICHEFTDHCHKDTLLEVHRNVPVFAASEAAKVIRGWQHFRMVIALDVFGSNGMTDWRATSVLPLPEWIGLSRLLSSNDALNYHSAILITWNNRHVPGKIKMAEANSNGTMIRRHTTIEPHEDEESAEAIIYTPHGVNSKDFNVITDASPPISTLAFLHGLHNVRLASIGRTALQLNLGVYNGLKAQRVLNSQYWIGTHDEIKQGRGLVGYFIKRDVQSIKDALEQENRQRQNGNHASMNSEYDEVLASFDDTRWLDLRNGESRVLS